MCSSPTTVLKRPTSQIDEVAVILPAAIASICANGVEKPVRIAFDSCSQKSFVTRKIINYSSTLLEKIARLFLVFVAQL